MHWNRTRKAVGAARSDIVGKFLFCLYTEIVIRRFCLFGKWRKLSIQKTQKFSDYLPYPNRRSTEQVQFGSKEIPCPAKQPRRKAGIRTKQGISELSCVDKKCRGSKYYRAILTMETDLMYWIAPTASYAPVRHMQATCRSQRPAQ